MRRDVWDDQTLDQSERQQPTAAGFVLTILVMGLVVVLAGAVLGSCGIPWYMLD